MSNEEHLAFNERKDPEVSEKTILREKPSNSHSRSHLEQNLDYSVIELVDEGINPLTMGSLFYNYIKPGDYELIILVTAYNEGVKEFKSTIEEGIEQNIPDLKIPENKKVGVVVITDGLEPFLKATRRHQGQKQGTLDESLATKKCDYASCEKQYNNPGCNYFNQFVKWKIIRDFLNSVYGKEHILANINENEARSEPNANKRIVKPNKIHERFKSKETEKAHLFCQEIQLKDNSFRYNLMFCIKQENKKKLNTHAWFLKGFCKSINPKYVIFLDVGTRPLAKSLSLLYTCLENNSEVAGCCGEILPDSRNCFNFVEQAQVVEYKFSHIFDKSLESLFGYISVLPGAFSAYRFECFTEEILDIYFFTERNTNIGLFEANMYLAEDRILCLEMVCMRENKYLLRYVPGSKAETDVPDELYILINQRRRWNNGAWFSSIYTIRNWSKIRKSGHSYCRQACLTLLMCYYVISTLFSWVLVGAFYLSFSISLKRNLQETNNDLNKLDKFSTPVIMFYVSTLIAMVVISLSTKPEKVKNFLKTLSVIFGLFTILSIALALRFIFRDSLGLTYSIRENISIFLLILMIFVSMLNILLKYPQDIPVIVKGLFQFFFLTGTYVNMFMIYSICNIHDVSWGNRPGGESTSETQKAHFESQRVTWLIIWILSNGLFAFFVNWLSGGEDENARRFILYFAWITFGVIFVKILGGLLYVFYTWCCMKTNTSTRSFRGQV